MFTSAQILTHRKRAAKLNIAAIPFERERVYNIEMIRTNGAMDTATAWGTKSAGTTNSRVRDAGPFDPQQADGFDSKEFKMLLDPQVFKNVEKGVSKLWDRVEESADDAGVKVKKSKKDEVREQDIVFLDTPKHELIGKGYVLRFRDLPGKSDDNLTLKFRSRNPSVAADANVDSAKGLESKPKLELDQVFGSEEASIYSHSNKVKLAQPSKDLKSVSDVFPVLGTLDLDPGTTLENVHGGEIHEERYLLGQVKLGKSESAPAYLTLWYDDEHGKTPAIAEFSFAHEAHSKESGTDQKSEELMRHLRDHAQEWLVADGTTKTGFAYGGRPKGQEPDQGA